MFYLTGLKRISALDTGCHSPWVPVVWDRKLLEWLAHPVSPSCQAVCCRGPGAEPSPGQGQAGSASPVGSTDRALQDGHGLRSAAPRARWILHRLSNMGAQRDLGSLSRTLFSYSWFSHLSLDQIFGIATRFVLIQK